MVEEDDIVGNAIAVPEYYPDNPKAILHVSLRPVFELLKALAHRFEHHYPAPLVFRKQKNRTHFAAKGRRQAVKLTPVGPIYPTRICERDRTPSRLKQRDNVGWVEAMRPNISKLFDRLAIA